MADRAGFDVLYRREHPGLVRALWVLSGDQELAADVVDEAFSRALARWGRVSAMESPGGWVRTVAANLHRRTVRRRAMEGRVLRRRRPVTQPEPPVPDLELWEAVGSLPMRQRELIVLRYVADFTEAEAAETLGISEGAASASLTKARLRLAELLCADQEVSQS